MHFAKLGTMTAALALLVACSQPDTTANTETHPKEKSSVETQAHTETEPTVVEDTKPTEPAVHKYGHWAGKWIGVEGMYAEIILLQSGTYKLVMQSDLDTLGTYEGVDGERGINFKRGDANLTLFQSTGDDIGLKYLAGKQNCLGVKEYEGYCRD